MVISRNKQFLFLTNNSGKTPKELQEKLARMGLEVDEHHFYTSALATAEFISRQSPGAHVFVIGNLDYTMPYMKRASPWMTPPRIML